MLCLRHPVGPQRERSCYSRYPLNIPHPGFPRDGALFFPEQPSNPLSPSPLPIFHNGPGVYPLTLAPNSHPLSLRHLSTPRHFCVPWGRSASHPCYLNRKLHKRKPSESVLPSTPSTLGTPEGTPKHQEPPRSYLPLTRAPLAAASSEERPPRTSSGQEPSKGGTPSSRNLFRRLQRGPWWRTSGLFPRLCPTPPLPGPYQEPPSAPVQFPRRRLGRLFPSLTDVPSPRTSSRSASPGASRSSAAGLRH